MRLDIASLLFVSFTLISAIPDLQDAVLSKLPLSKVPTSRPLLTRQSDSCTGSGVTCASCFGSGYTECPDGVSCYNPSNPTTSCTASGGTFDYCYQFGATCVSCFGSGYLSCPGDSKTCYNPNNPQYDTCPDGSGGGSTSTCADQYGAGSVECGPDGCYNPAEGDVCCVDGSHCEGGDTCSSPVGKCCPLGSTNAACGGAGADSSSSLSAFNFETESARSTPTTRTFAATAGTITTTSVATFSQTKSGATQVPTGAAIALGLDRDAGICALIAGGMGLMVML
ncbi:hypothetical protein BKA61DRAFT_624708 [Leptodontidium sp. MPI-SDFR-AT-0119]|nr:hypothetical protein BKA61DRAFT_624708 [Leptodontidium sp. MPI-SDFR-AT-0119]